MDRNWTARAKHGHDIIVVGGSAGSIDVLRRVAAELEQPFEASMFVVIHTNMESPRLLPAILERAGSIPAAFAAHDRLIEPGRIYVAPPGTHLMLEADRTLLVHGPRENRARPAVDPLFRSAASAYGSRVIGVVLSGMLDDGARGLRAIKEAGGIAVVQSPDDAVVADMPRNALLAAAVDHQVPAASLAQLLERLVRTPARAGIRKSASQQQNARALLGIENLDRVGQRTPFTCPECGGALWQMREGQWVRYHCHVGHAYGERSFVFAQEQAMEAALWTALRALEESAAVRRRLEKRAVEAGQTATATAFDRMANESEEGASAIRRVLERRVSVDADEGVLDSGAEPATGEHG